MLSIANEQEESYAVAKRDRDCCDASKGGNSTAAGEVVLPIKWAAIFCNDCHRSHSSDGAAAMWRRRLRHSMSARSISPERSDSVVIR